MDREAKVSDPTRKRMSGTRPRSDINITPLIDVLLVLIVIFMVITPLAPQGIDASIPHQAPSEVSAPVPSLILSLDGNGAIFLNQEMLNFVSLAPRLREIFSTRADRTLFVQADDAILFNDVAHLIDAARGAGAGRIGLLTTHLTPNP